MRQLPVSAVQATAALLLTVAMAGCTSSAPPSAAPPSVTVRVASYDFTENQILAEVYAGAIRRAGLPVSVQHGVGTREVVEPALEQGVVDVVVDYLGTALEFVGQPDSPGAGSSADAQAALARAFAQRGVTVFDAARAEDQNGFAVSAAFAEEHGISRLSELAPLASRLTFGGPPECPQRPLCLSGLEKVYGLKFGHVRAMPSRSATVEALLAGDIDVGLLETTDARLAVDPVVSLVDDRGLQPHENVVPLVRTAVAGRWGVRLRSALDAVSARLTTEDLRQLNQAVEVEGRSPADAAARWLSG